MEHKSSSALSGLSDSFLSAMKTLFDVLDIEGSGWIHFNDIADAWNPDEQEDGDLLPSNVLESIRKVVNPEGKLSFERFCAGLKIALLRHEALQRSSTSSSKASNPSEESSLVRTNSLPNLAPPGGNQLPFTYSNLIPPSPVPSEPTVQHSLHQGPPKPPRDVFRSSGYLPDVPMPDPFWSPIHDQGKVSKIIDNSDLGLNNSKRRSVRRQNSNLRRHTLQGGIDISVMKRIKLWEREKMVLEEGLRAIEKCYYSYMDRLRRVQGLLRFGEDPSYSNSSINSEALQERLVFELQSVGDINHRLQCLAEGRPFVNINQAPQVDLNLVAMQERQIARLKEQNKMLTKEVGQKSNFITNLEQEKSLLIRQLFQARSTQARGNQNRDGANLVPNAVAKQSNFPSDPESTFS